VAVVLRVRAQDQTRLIELNRLILIPHIRSNIVARSTQLIQHVLYLTKANTYQNNPLSISSGLLKKLKRHKCCPKLAKKLNRGFGQRFLSLIWKVSRDES
jgi:hypothetical protein